MWGIINMATGHVLTCEAFRFFEHAEARAEALDLLHGLRIYQPVRLSSATD